MTSKKFIHQWSWPLPLAAAFTGLYLLYPYTPGYENNPQSVASVLWRMWDTLPDWEHGMLVPLICGYLLWHIRADIARTPAKPSSWGIPVILASLLAYWMGFRAEIQHLAFFSIQGLLAGIILWFRGWQMLRTLLFPLLFLTFAWPLPFLDNLVAFPLRLLMTEASHLLLQVIGIDNLKIGTSIVSAPDPAAGLAQGKRFAVDIANPCSGIRSLFALMMFSALYAWFMIPRLWQQLAVFLASIPFAIVGNMVRILLLTLGTIVFGSDFAIGTFEEPSTYHIGMGLLVYVVALGGVAATGWLLSLLPSKSKKEDTE